MTSSLDFYSGKHLLVTGGAGYLATNLVEQLRRVTCRITRVDLPGSAFPPIDGSPEVRNIDGDLRQPARWEELLEDIDIVFTGLRPGEKMYEELLIAGENVLPLQSLSDRSFGDQQIPTCAQMIQYEPAVGARLAAHLAHLGFVGVETENRYLFGYGMDYKGYLRNAAGIYACKEGDV